MDKIEDLARVARKYRADPDSIVIEFGVDTGQRHPGRNVHQGNGTWLYLCDPIMVPRPHRGETDRIHRAKQTHKALYVALYDMPGKRGPEDQAVLFAALDAAKRILDGAIREWAHTLPVDDPRRSMVERTENAGWRIAAGALDFGFVPLP